MCLVRGTAGARAGWPARRPVSDHHWTTRGGADSSGLATPRAPVQRAGGSGNADVPVQSPEPPFELRRLVGDLDHPECCAIAQLALNDRRVDTLDQFDVGAVIVIEEEDAPVGLE